jgi:concanavalin A-like lectin/glucanase superfamily protein/alpha-L-arabinofuranosidase B-like protein
MKKAFVLTFLLLAILPVQAAIRSVLQITIGAPAGYTGPGDVQSGALAWYSCSRAYSAAYATANGNMCTVTRASDSATCTFKAATDGTADLTVGTPCTGSTTVTAFCNATTCSVSGVYDQSGANGCTGAIPCDLPAPIAARQPPFTFSCVNSHPCINPNGAASSGLISTATIAAQAQPFTLIAAARRTGATTTTQIIISFGSSSATNLGYTTNVNEVRMNAGSTAPFNATDAGFHALAAVIQNTTSVGYSDGTATGGTTGTVTIGASADITLGNNSALTVPMTGYIGEAGVWPGAMTSTQAKAMCTNQRAWWGTGGAC